MPAAPAAGPAVTDASADEVQQLRGLATAMSRSLAVIEFDLDGTVLTANQNFLDTMGYTLREVRGEHHRMFCAPGTAESPEYRDFWAKLAEGAYVQDEFRRIAKGGREVWLQATYNPILDAAGKPVKVVKFASDTTAAKLRNAEFGGKVAAIQRSQAVIEFDLTGRVLTANQNFLDTMGYTLTEIQGQHHRIFCPPEVATSEEYAEFWAKLGAGAFERGEYKRLAKGGRPVWLQATYNPIIGIDGRPRSIVKYASDVTAAKEATAEFLGKVAALDRAQAVAEFGLDGKLLTANHNFLTVMGYTLPELQGRHHRIFCDAAYAATREYADFWERLSTGQFESGEYVRRAKGGREVWLQATYNPIFDVDGNPVKVVKFASDVTAAKATNADFLGKVAAMERAQAVIEFDLEGRVVTANRNFLDVLGYSLNEIQGKHHRMFCDADVAASQEYADFWERLGAGQFEAGEYKRLGRGGREVWLQATYNPILDASGKPVKVVKFATDVTATKLRTAEIQARINAVDRAQAVIEFDLDGMVLDANENFLRTVGYSLREIVGQHHSMFCSDDYTRSTEYRDFWLRLGKGDMISGRFHRRGNYGRDVYIQATYNPVMDLTGTPFKVIKYAYDVTAEVEREHRINTGTTEMTASVRNLATSIDEISQNSRSATELATETHGNAEEGVEALRASIEAIGMIQKSSAAITDIVRVMGEIANQTNLLAFNASIEAARAGEHGVGFSIVAGEVRKLAERSFEAAQQIGVLIEESAERVAQGSEVSKRAETAFERIAKSVSRTNDAIRSISASTRVQQAASAEVEALIVQLSSSTTS
ncbi:PAS domain S-box protein [Modestobacter sp. I12A-02628]|uniref:PAS domain S-box protein n=1 Tax=Goekera deserti TaxID=2497753 RepID=A0A7K3WHE1_9ACTN|nr:PAS domain-containing methyl-accepting chemotaxis protein [Goekera deserti]MPQ97836.1 PAS domain S-box protein [Goekera deserti]NDI48481.1 PAS domain S-box protein [Goekera deserti]NEL55140.1 PAS domain S-box protein [Goekera deserti]